MNINQLDVCHEPRSLRSQPVNLSLLIFFCHWVALFFWGKKLHCFHMYCESLTYSSRHGQPELVGCFSPFNLPTCAAYGKPHVFSMFVPPPVILSQQHTSTHVARKTEYPYVGTVHFITRQSPAYVSISIWKHRGGAVSTKCILSLSGTMPIGEWV